MIDCKTMFQRRKINMTRLLAFGFQPQGKSYHYTTTLLQGQFLLQVQLAADASVQVKVFDTVSREEYAPVYAAHASGAFVGGVIQACEEQLKIIAQQCFDKDIFQSPQTQQIIDYVQNTYQNELEFLWDKFPDNAIFRRSDNRKWYAALLTVPGCKIGLPNQLPIEIIDLRAQPDDIPSLLNQKGYFPGYHMNKKHWYTICCNDSVPTEEIQRRIDQSYLLAKK